MLFYFHSQSTLPHVFTMTYDRSKIDFFELWTGVDGPRRTFKSPFIYRWMRVRPSTNRTTNRFRTFFHNAWVVSAPAPGIVRMKFKNFYCTCLRTQLWVRISENIKFASTFIIKVDQTTSRREDELTFSLRRYIL